MNKPKTFDIVVRKFVFLLGLLILSPFTLSLGFKALKIYTKNPEIFIAYTLLTIGGFLIIFTVYFGFKTIKAFLNHLFDN